MTVLVTMLFVLSNNSMPPTFRVIDTASERNVRPAIGFALSAFSSYHLARELRLPNSSSSGLSRSLAETSVVLLLQVGFHLERGA